MREVVLFHFLFRWHLGVRKLTRIPHLVLLLRLAPYLPFLYVYRTYGLLMNSCRIIPTTAHFLAGLGKGGLTNISIM